MGGKNPLCGKLRTSIKQLEDNGSQIGTHEFHMHVYGVFDAKVSVFQKLVPAMSKIQRRAARVLPKQGVGSVVSSLASRKVSLHGEQQMLRSTLVGQPAIINRSQAA